jgi:hypothetical protein
MTQADMRGFKDRSDRDRKLLATPFGFALIDARPRRLAGQLRDFAAAAVRAERTVGPADFF